MSNGNDKTADARNAAALRGAALAFAKPKPPPNRIASYGLPSRERGAAAAASLANLKPMPQAITRPALSTNPSAPSLRAAELVVARRGQTLGRTSLEQTRPELLTLRPAVLPRAYTVAAAPPRHRSTSPSNIAAVLAASRHSSISRIGSTPGVSPHRVTPQRSTYSSVVNGGREAYQTHGPRVSDVQTWLESLQYGPIRDLADVHVSHGEDEVENNNDERPRRKSSQQSGRSRATDLEDGLDGMSLARGRSFRRAETRPTSIPTIDIAVASPEKQKKTARQASFDMYLGGVESAYSASVYSGYDGIAPSHAQTDANDYFRQGFELQPFTNTTSLSLAAQPSRIETDSIMERWTRPTDHARRHSIAPTLRKYNKKDLRLSKWAETVVAQPQPRPDQRYPPSSASQAYAIDPAAHAGTLVLSRNPSPEKPIASHTEPLIMCRQSHESQIATPFSRPSGEYTSYLSLPSANSPPTRIRTPSPNKALRPTLRKTVSSTTDDENRHKHHEGDRKRWRDAITIRERKRYEGVWAANRGIFVVGSNTTAPTTPRAATSPASTAALDNAAASGTVSNLIVRDIWTRSRLPSHVLEEVWDLVDRTDIGQLDREEFVVGMWLIDQRLKGRKLPVKVGSSVWNSVRGIYGMRYKG
jgi:hypothetical protein